MALAHPDLAIARPVAGSPWPLGTRSSRIAPDDRAPAADGGERDHRRSRQPPGDSLSGRSRRPAGPPRSGRRPAADAGSRGTRLRRHAAAVSVGAAGLAADPRAPDTRALALVAVAVGRRAAGARRRCGSRRGARGARRRSGGRRCPTARRALCAAANPAPTHAADRVRRTRRRGARSGRAPGRPGPCVEPRRHRVSRRAAPGPSETHLPARHRVDRRGAGAGAAAGHRRRLRDARSTAGRWTRAGICRS